jgi:hypothetical protein
MEFSFSGGRTASDSSLNKNKGPLILGGGKMRRLHECNLCAATGRTLPEGVATGFH